MLWVYAVCEAPAAPPSATAGLADAPLHAVRAGPLAAVVSRHAEQPAATRAALWEHERVVEAMMADRTVLPMRFASTVADEPRLRAFLDGREAALASALARVRGHVELSVRALRDTNRPPAVASASDERLVDRRDDAGTTTPPRVTAGERGAAVSGRAYLLAKLARERDADDAADRLHGPLAALAAHARRSPPRSADEVLRAAYLIAPSRTAVFRRRVERLHASRADVVLLCTGPWPPYSFVDGLPG